ncbi:hypothetical protein NSU_3059 [Novosphingobium pentaromativorans US6-1]|uniref:Uncharacterized protein n=1 Tax=Novosphingobium pentaromativorans US6-1 TaxID=1088721 RepID=G6EFD8_9SPHN|nr:hypothetical protein NSU_3059 [Novosphingobium pentaromativorans US6-1]
MRATAARSISRRLGFGRRFSLYLALLSTGSWLVAAAI